MTTFLEEINTEQKEYLQRTDWYVIRFIETGIPVPPEITAARQAARDYVEPEA